MTLDTEQQRALLLQLVDQSSFPGSAVKTVFQLRQAIESAEIARSASVEN